MDTSSGVGGFIIPALFAHNFVALAHYLMIYSSGVLLYGRGANGSISHQSLGAVATPPAPLVTPLVKSVHNTITYKAITNILLI